MLHGKKHEIYMLSVISYSICDFTTQDFNGGMNQNAREITSWLGLARASVPVVFIADTCVQAEQRVLLRRERQPGSRYDCGPVSHLLAAYYPI